MFQVAERLFQLFGFAEKRADVVSPDPDGRGLQERLVRCLGVEYDEHLLPLVDGFVGNLLNPETALARFVPYLEQQMGVAYQVSDDLPTRRKLIAWAPRITRLKGTRRSYDILLKLMGFETVEIVEHFVAYGFDSPLTWDDPDRRLDGRCRSCSEYSLVLTGTLTMSAELRAWIRSVVAFCEPINARLRDSYYNEFPLALNHILVRKTPAGHLVYDNSAVPATMLVLTPEGRLIVRGPDATRYRLNAQGNLIFTL